MKAKLRGGQDWQIRHNDAIDGVVGIRERVTPAKHEASYLLMLGGWETYARAHKNEFGSSIGDDGVLGPAWESIGDGLRELLNGEVGARLDCGTLDSFIVDTMKDNNVDVETK